MDNDSPDYPIAIIGGGLAGSAAAATLARNGWPAALFERDTFPRDKLCGEFLSGESRRLLRDLGCLDAILRYNPPEIRQVRFITAGDRRVLVPLPTPALGLSRKRLDEILFNHSRACGAEAFSGCEISGIANCSDGLRLYARRAYATAFSTAPRIVIGAYGRRSKLDRDVKRPFLQRLDNSVGLKLHHHFRTTESGRTARRELAETTEIYGLDGGYCGVALVEGDVVNVCMLLQRGLFSQVGSSQWSAVSTFLAQQNPALGARLAALHAVDKPVLTVSQMPFSPKEKSQGGILYAGDAAGMIAPLCGDGMAMALESGMAVAELLMRHFAEPGRLVNSTVPIKQLGRMWQAEWNKTFRNRVRIGKALQRLLLSPIAAEISATILSRMPGKVPAKLARLTRGQ